MMLPTTTPARRRVTYALTPFALVVTLVGGGAALAPGATAATLPLASSSTSALGPAALVGTRTYSKATVARHNRASDCWAIVDGNVYNLTTFVTKHPGGRKRIIRMCGRDASAAFHGQHSSGSRASRVVLKRYRIGTLRA